jgi:hypothetical protein
MPLAPLTQRGADSSVAPIQIQLPPGATLAASRGPSAFIAGVCCDDAAHPALSSARLALFAASNGSMASSAPLLHLLTVVPTLPAWASDDSTRLERAVPCWHPSWPLLLLSIVASKPSGETFATLLALEPPGAAN